MKQYRPLLFIFVLMCLLWTMAISTLSAQQLKQIQKGTAPDQIPVTNGTQFTQVYRDAIPYILDSLGIRDSLMSDFPLCIDSIFINSDSLYYIIAGDTINAGPIGVDLPDYLLSIARGPDNSLYSYNDFGASDDVVHSLMPEGGITGQAVRKTATSYEWQDYENIDTIILYPNLYYLDGYGLIDSANCNVLRIRKVNNVLLGNQWISICNPSDTALINQIISDSLASYVFVTDTSLIREIVSDSISIINVISGDDIQVIEGPHKTFIVYNLAPDQTVSITGAGITNVTGTYPNFTVTSTEVDGSTTNEKINNIAWNNTTDSIQVVENGVIYRAKINGFQDELFAGVNIKNLVEGTGIDLSSGGLLGSGAITISNTLPEVTTVSDGLTVDLTMTIADITAEVKANSIDSTHINTSGIGTTDIADNVVKFPKLQNSGVTPSTYNNVTVNNKGIVTSGSNVAYGSGTVTSVGLGLGTSGTDANIIGSPITSSGSFTLNLPSASASNRGLLLSADWNTFNNKLDGSGTTNYIPKWSSGTALGNSLAFDNGTTFSVGAAGSPNSAGRFESFKSYSNTSDVNIVASGNIPLIGFNKTSSYRFAIGSGYASASTLSILGAASVSTNPTSQLIDITNTGDVLMYGNLQVNNNTRLGTASSEFSFNSLGPNPTNAQVYFNLSGSQRFRIQGAAGLSYMDFFTPASGSNRNFSFATSYNSPGDFNLLRSTTAGGTPSTLVWTANTTGLGIGTGSPTNTLDVDGTLRVRTTSGTATSLMGRDANGVLISVPISGLTMSTGTLTNSNTGTVTGTGTANTIPYFSTTTALSSTPFTYGSNIMTIPTNNSIYFPGNAVIIDKNNSGGAAGEILSRAASGGGMDWIPLEGTDLEFTTKVGTDVPLVSSTGPGISPKFRDGINILVTQVSASVMSVNTNVSYGYMASDGSVTQTVNSGTDYKIQISNAIANGVITTSDANDRITVSATGIYEISYDLGYSYSNGTSSTVFRTFVNKNGSSAIAGLTATERPALSVSFPQNIGRSAIVSLNSGDYIELFITLEANSASVTYTNANLHIKRID